MAQAAGFLHRGMRCLKSQALAFFIMAGDAQARLRLKGDFRPIRGMGLVAGDALIHGHWPVDILLFKSLLLITVTAVTQLAALFNGG